MEDILNQKGENDKEQRGVSPSQIPKTFKQTYNIAKKVIKATRLLAGSIPLLGFSLIILAIISIFFLFFMFFGVLAPIPGGSLPGSPVSKNPPIPGLTLTLTGPDAVDNGTNNLEYTVTVTYDKTTATVPIKNITVYLDIPANSSFVRASGNNTQSGNTISWLLSDTQNQSAFTFVLNPSINDITIPVKVYAKANGSSGNPPSTNNCGGKYPLDNPIGNFGDPVCDFNKDELYTLLQSLDPANASRWYTVIVPCESGYIPNSYNPSSYSGSGAYGLFQMNPSNHGYNPLDAGDIEWRQQTQNAISYSKLIPSLGAYWACAQ